jgi:hypothetical protein
MLLCEKGRQTKVATKAPFLWYIKPRNYEPKFPFDGKIIEEMKHVKSISVLFKKIISLEMIRIIAYYTNKRIERINTEKYTNEKYRDKLEKIKLNKVSDLELYAYVGLLILFGLTNKNEISIDMLWSDKSFVHFTPFASVAMSREMFQLISRHICFDDFDTRSNRQQNKFHKMEATFNLPLVIKNLALVIPSYYLCIDETLYAFRGICGFRQYIPSKPARYGIKFWCLVDVNLSLDFIKLSRFIFIFHSTYLITKAI